MRRSLPAFLGLTLLAALPGPAAAQLSPQVLECQRIFGVYQQLRGRVQAIEDEMAVNQMALRYNAGDVAKVTAYTADQLKSAIEATDQVIALNLKPRTDGRQVDPDRARQRVMAMERWRKVLVEFQSNRAFGIPIDPNHNAFTRWRAKAANRQAKLTAELPQMRALAAAVKRDHDRCKAAAGTSPARAPAAAAPGGLTRAPRVFVTTLGDVTLTTTDDGVVNGVYEFDTGQRFANGPLSADLDLSPGFRVRGGSIVGQARLRGGRNGQAIEGYWFENDARRACPQPREGYPSWGQFRWEFEGPGRWVGKRSRCGGPMNETWDGQPKR